MSNAWERDRATPFYLGLGVAGLGVVGFGFGYTYGVPMVRGTFSGPWFVHLHGATALGWVVLFIAQAALVVRNRSSLHRRAGKLALPLAVMVWASGIATAVWAAKRDLPQQGSAATSAMAGTVTGLTLFLLLVAAAIAMRTRPDWHKRLVLLATVHVLWPAFFRLRHWLPAIPDPEIWLALVLAYSPLLFAAARDRSRYGQIHPVWLFVAPALVIEQGLEVATFDRGSIKAFGEWLFALLT